MIKLRINNKEHSLEPESGASLLSVLRDQLGFTGTKYGCGDGDCGACTVLVEGVPKRSCVMDATSAAGKSIETIESLGTPEKLHPVQSAFIEQQAFQCGYCTTGMIMATVGLLRKTPAPTDTEIVKALNGNLCRCGTYPRIIAAVKQAATQMKAQA